MLGPTVFLDRDGRLWREPNYLAEVPVRTGYSAPTEAEPVARCQGDYVAHNLPQAVAPILAGLPGGARSRCRPR